MKLQSILKVVGVVLGGGALGAVVPEASGDCFQASEVSTAQLLVAGSTILMGLAGLFAKRPQDH